MFENILKLAGIYLILIYLGIGIFVLIVPSYFKKSYLYAVIPPMLGCCLLAIIGSWVISLNMFVLWVLIFSLIIATGLNLFVLWQSKLWRKIVFKKPSFKNIVSCVLFMAILSVLAIPAIRQDDITTPLRLNGDTVGYAGAAQALVNGETLSSIGKELESVEGNTNLKESELSNSLLLRFDLHCSSAFLLCSLRWGYPIILAAMTLATNLGSVYGLDFLLLIFAWAMLLGLLYFACKEIMKAPFYICWGLVVALALNCNLLNVYYEGSYAQIMAMPIIFMIMLYVYNLIKTQGNKREFVFVGFCCATIIAIYFESFISLMVVFAVLVGLLWFVFPKIKRIWVGVLGFGALSAFVVVAPLTWSWIMLAKNVLSVYLKNISIGGWWQPQWATLPEIMGWINIYIHGIQATLFQRSTIEIIFACLGSILILLAIGYYIRNKKADGILWLAAPIFVLLVLIKCVNDRTNNYQYYKSYTEFLPIIFLFVFMAIYYLVKIVKFKYFVYGFITLAVLATFYSGIGYIKTYYSQSTYFTQEMFSLQKDSAILSGYVLMTPSIQPYYYQWEQLAGVTKINWYDYVFEQQNNVHLIDEPYLNMPVAIVIFKGEPKGSGSVIYSNKDFEIVRTPYTLEQGLDKNGNVDINNYLGAE
jgi:hypothetical protein